MCYQRFVLPTLYLVRGKFNINPSQAINSKHLLFESVSRLPPKERIQIMKKSVKQLLLCCMSLTNVLLTIFNNQAFVAIET